MLYQLELVIDGVEETFEIESQDTYAQVLDAKVTELNRQGKEVYMPCKLCTAQIINSKAVRLASHKNMDAEMVSKTNSTERLYNICCKYGIEAGREAITGHKCVNPNRTVNSKYAIKFN
jgi:hypothetical protein